MKEKNSSSLKHVAIIMDGNRRWAKQHKLVALRGHEYVAEKVLEPLVDEAIALKIGFLTLWAFSTENWHRDQEEVAGLMQLFRRAFSDRNLERLHKKSVRLQTIGDITKFPTDLQQSIATWIQKTADNTAITVTFALNYGGRDELVRAITTLSETGQPINHDTITTALDTGKAQLPEPDLIIRPGGEQRLSGFMPWQGIYAELYFTQVLMPDFSGAELRKAVDEYHRRQRRFGT